MIETLLVALGIFLIRIIGNAISTLRLVMLARDRDVAMFILSFLESLTFAVAISAVVANLSSLINLIAYSGGFAVGNYLGVWLERKLTIGYVQLAITSPQHGKEIANAIRQAGFGATEIIGYGVNGEVMIVESVIERRHLKTTIEIAQSIDPLAFITTRSLQNTFYGFIPSVRPGLYLMRNRPLAKIQKSSKITKD
ncbi:MAG: hypothetical protein CUN55_12095 [Phototrophicales bacterium]|nr:MAG: hypothetical protein CUN55_12095 [Phototrophicales bacterium]